jgi:hypothetical protein
MSNTVPYEVIAAPYDVWVAPVGTAFPDVGATPAGPWAKVGSSGSLNYDDAAGVTVEHSQSVSPWRSLGDAGSRKIFRTEEDLKIKLKLVDVTLEQYKHAINSNSVTTVPASLGLAGYKKLGLSRGFTVATVALLVRGSVSPYGSDWNMQYEVPIAAQSGNPSVVYKKGEPAGLELEWMALVDASASSEDERFGRLVEQNDDLGT